MRPLSRLLSVFLALILLATSFLVASAHDGDPTAKITIARVDSASDVYVGTKLKFLVIIERGGHDIVHDAKIRSVHSQLVDNNDPATPDDTTDDDDTPSAAEVDLSTASGVMAAAADSGYTADEAALTSTHPVGTIAEFVYTVQSEELGAAKERNIPIQFQLTVADASRGGLHANANLDTTAGNEAFQIKSNIVNVLVTKDPGTGDGSSQVTVNVAMERPDEIAAGEKVKFKVSTETKKYGFGPKPMIISKQLYDEDGKDGGKVAVAVFTLADLQSNSVSPEQSKEYTLVQDDIDATKVEFSYAVEITSTDLGPPAAPGNYTTDKTQKGTFNLAPPAPEPEVSMYLYETEHAKVKELGDSAVVLTRLDTMNEITLRLGTLSGTGALLPQNGGYIRDMSRGQTYAVVKRASDDKVVRAWIPSHSEWVDHIVWENVIAFYNVPAEVLNAIPLDDTMPEAEQLVDVAGKYYVYRDRAWRHIPNLPTFRANSFYWCDLTTADSSHAAASSTATPLPSRVGPPAEGYPACR